MKLKLQVGSCSAALTKIATGLQAEEIKGRLGGPVQKAAVSDADGGLNFQEYAALLTARYKSVNGNGDGLVDPSELDSLTGQLLLVMMVR